MKRVNNEIYSILFTCNFDLVYDPKHSLCQVLQVRHTLIFPTLNCEIQLKVSSLSTEGNLVQ